MRLQAELGFTEPRLFGSNYAGGFDVFYRDTDYTTQSSFKSQKVGGDLRLGYPISDEWSGSVNYTFSRNTISRRRRQCFRRYQGGGARASQRYFQHLLHLLRRLHRWPTTRATTSGDRPRRLLHLIARIWPASAATCAICASVGDARGYYAVSDDHHGGGSRHGRRDRRLGRAGCAPPRPVLSGRRDACAALPSPASGRATS